MTIDNTGFRITQPTQERVLGEPVETLLDDNHPVRALTPPYEKGIPSWTPPSWLLALNNEPNRVTKLYQKTILPPSFSASESSSNNEESLNGPLLNPIATVDPWQQSVSAPAVYSFAIPEQGDDVIPSYLLATPPHPEEESFFPSPVFPFSEEESEDPLTPGVYNFDIEESDYIEVDDNLNPL